LQQPLQPAQAGVQADVVVDPDELLAPQAESRPRTVVQVVGVGHDGVQAVVAAGHLQHDEDVVLAGTGCPRRGRKEARHRRPQGDQGRRLEGPFQQFAAVQPGGRSFPGR
jgi:hypothetical protein